MTRMLFVLNVLLSSNIQGQLASLCPIKILVFYLPIENDYYVSVSPEDIFIHRETKILESEDKDLEKKFGKVLKNLHNNQVDSSYKYIDVRVLIEFLYKNGDKGTLTLDRFGRYMINDVVYKKDLRLLKFFEDNFKEIRWGKYVYQ